VASPITRAHRIMVITTSVTSHKREQLRSTVNWFNGPDSSPLWKTLANASAKYSERIPVPKSFIHTKGEQE